MPKPQLVKNPPEAPTETAARTPARDKTADEYGPLAAEYALLSSRLRVLTAEGSRYSALKDEIRSWFKDKAPDAKFIYESDRYLLEVSAMENEAEADKPKLYKILGAKTFLELASISQKAVKDELTLRGKPGIFASFFQWQRTGDRKVAALPKALNEAA